LKDYNKYVVWLEYFNSELKRGQGRRIPLDSAVRAPKLEELEEACRRLNLEPLAQPAKHPNSATRETGYVSIRKEKPKQALIVKIARELSAVRAQAQKK
jgi:signal recognition particle subunit SRP19